MPFTVITLQTVPQSLRGDLSKWMQEIATGVYVGNFNVKIRQELWERVLENVGSGQATISYSCRNEIGYNFESYRSQRSTIDSDGIPLVIIKDQKEEKEVNYGFSKAAKLRKARIFQGVKPDVKESEKTLSPFVVLDIETDGLNERKNKILEIGAVKYDNAKTESFHRLIKYQGKLKQEIKNLTGIDEKLLEEACELELAIKELKEFIGKLPIVGYAVDFDMRFINQACKNLETDKIRNEVVDLMFYVKKEKRFLDNYKLQTVLKDYGIEKTVLHRALSDAELEFQLALKMESFLNKIKR